MHPEGKDTGQGPTTAELRTVPCPRTDPHPAHRSDETPGNPGSPLGPPVRCPGVPTTAARRTVGGYPASGKPVSAPPASVSRPPDRPQVVTWEDTTNIATWQDRDDIAEFARDGGWRCQNIGWVVYEDDECIVLAARRAFDKQAHVGLAERIPRRAIIHQEAL